jgi:hypothetical protein
MALDEGIYSTDAEEINTLFKEKNAEKRSKRTKTHNQDRHSDAKTQLCDETFTTII